MKDYRDLRDWITKAEGVGEVQRINGVHWDLELGAIEKLSQDRPQAPALLFDEIVDYPRGYRVLADALRSFRRLALTLGMPLDARPLEFVRAWRQIITHLPVIPPKQVSDGPVLEQVLSGDRVDLFRFPAPRWNEQDGGRYLGTGCVWITADPDSGWVNLGTYRAQLHDRQTIGFYASPGHHGRIHREKAFARGEGCKVAVSLGQDPLLLIGGALELGAEVAEYDFVGGLQGEPVEVVKGPYTGLPIPARAEIVLEGDCLPGETCVEGPFGEWTGYYASSARPEPILKVKTILHRNDPIILGMPPTSPTCPNVSFTLFVKAALVWEELEQAGVPDVRGVWYLEPGGPRLLLVVAIKQRYPGHARQAGLVAAGCHAANYMGRYVIVVDEDIDPSDTSAVLWALATRTDPKRSIDIIDRCWSGPLDPAMPKEQWGFSSRAIIDACRPYERLAEFPQVMGLSPALKEKTLKRWETQLAPWPQPPIDPSKSRR